MVLLDAGGHHPGHADAVAAHLQHHRPAGLIQHRGVKRRGVFVPQLKDMTHLDAPPHRQGAFAVRARVTLLHPLRRQFHVRRVITLAAEHDLVLTGIRQHMKLVGDAAAYVAGVGDDGAVVQPQAVEDAAVGAVHQVVGLLQRGLVRVEGVGIFHHELPRPHHTEAGPAFVPEFGLNLIKNHRQLPVTVVFVPHQIGDDLLVGGAEAEVPLVTILKAQQFRAHGLPTPGLPPQFAVLHHGHGQLQRAGFVHLLPHHRADLVQHPHPQRQPGVDAAGELPNQPRPKHEPMTDHLGIGGGLLLGG